MALFGLFGKKSSGFLGVDIGAAGLKVVELSKEKGRTTLQTYGYSETRADGAPFSPFDDTKATGELLAKICKEAGVKSTAAMAALPLSHVFSAIVAVPRRKDQKELKQLVDAQIAKLTPLPMNEMVTYSTLIDDPMRKDAKGAIPESTLKAGEKDYVRVLVTGAAKTLVQKYIEIFRAAKLTLQAIDTESFALIRSLVGKDRSAVMVLDIGNARTNITVVEKGVPVLTRSINVGGGNVTKKIMAQMGVSAAEAEQMKLDLGNFTSATKVAGGMPEILESVVQPILHEIRFSFQLYANMELTDLKKVEKIIVTGGSAHLPNVPAYLAETLNMNVYKGDPWARISYPEDLRPVLDEIGPRLSVAAGLAMRELE